ncbi:MAG: transcriptional repressor [Clostridia bacterium]|nr:transcriptional repressor [Clostridia bacterium]
MKAVRNTQQKELIKNIVEEACDHPTADMIYERAQAELPKISLGTVYRILRELVNEGLILEIPVNGKPSRFDKTIMNHGHFICDKCGKVYDIFFDFDKFMGDIDFKENKTDKTYILFSGTCSECK